MSKNDANENNYKCANCGPVESFIVEGTISVSQDERVIDYLDCDLRCPKCGSELVDEFEKSLEEIPEVIKAADKGANAKEKIMNSLLDAVWDEIPIEIDELITEEELFQWKLEWWKEHDPEQYPGGGT